MFARTAAILVLGAMAVGSAEANEAWIVKESASSAEQTADQLVEAAEKAGATVFARVDHAAGAQSVGTELPPTIMVMFGNPRIGTPLIAANRRAGLDLPIRVLIWEEDGATRLGYEQPRTLAERYELSDVDDSLEAMGNALDKLTTVAAGGASDQ